MPSHGTQGVPPLNQSTSTWCCKRANQEGDDWRWAIHHVAMRPECTTRAQDRVESQWTTLDDVCLQEVFKQRFAILQGCPTFEGEVPARPTTALEAVHTTVQQNDVAKEIRGWKLFIVLPFWLLRRPFSRGRVKKAELSQRFDLFIGGQWDELHQEVMRDAIPAVHNNTTPLFHNTKIDDNMDRSHGQQHTRAENEKCMVDFGQFRLWPISTSANSISANSISASWPKSNCPKSIWPKSSILATSSSSPTDSVSPQQDS